MATSVQDMVRPGECLDIYYYDGETNQKQCWPTTQNTKFSQGFQNLRSGTSTFTIPPNMGIQDIVVEMKMPSVNPNTGLALPRGWGYALIKQVSFRYGGSSTYFLTGDQVLQNALRRQTNRQSADDILSLGGSFLAGADLNTSTNYATVVLTLPHNIPSGVGKAFPLPSDLLTQQVIVQVELNPIGSVFSVNPGGGSSPTPVELDLAQFVVQQVTFNNQGDSLARRVDMSVNAYAMPVEFVQQRVQVPLTTDTEQELSLTGFRSGEVTAIHCWITSDGDQNGSLAGNVGAVNPFRWYPALSYTVTYAGDVYARYENASSALWALINGNKTPAVDNVLVNIAAPPTGTSILSEWAELPFAQTHVSEDAHYTLVHGKAIQNGILNLRIVLDATTAAIANKKLNISYIYNSTLLFSQGTCDYSF